LILPLGKWVLQKSARQVRKWQEKYPEHGGMAVSVNLSARQLQNPSLLEDILEVLAQSDLEPNQLILEITESVMIHDIDASVARLRQLKQLGVRLAIDDFGTGYSSLGILQQVPADTLKIAKQFVDGIGNDATREDFASAIIKLGQTVHMDVVAEGIESVRQAERLAQLGCHYGQGFLFSPPLTSSEIDEQLRRAVSFGTSFARESAPNGPTAPVIDLPIQNRAG
jgi:EAL domain-containing protein (putative c-di-GMP-specific phosphodiesterase class I)